MKIQMFYELQVDVRRQKSAFPPNFVHSLDGSHMMMTAVACREAGLRFAGCRATLFDITHLDLEPDPGN